MESLDRPSMALLCKLGSLIVHADELMSPGGHPFDKNTFDTGLADPEVKAWLAAMQKAAFVPVKR